MEDPSTTQVWTRIMINELGRLSQRFGNEKGTDTIKWMTQKQIRTIPKNRTFIYSRMVVNYRGKKRQSVYHSWNKLN